MTAEILHELWVARELLSVHGGDRRSDQRNKSSIETWSTYCRDIGSSRQVVNRWLAVAPGVRVRGRKIPLDKLCSR